MKPSRCLTSTCRSCRYYSHEGRRGGLCHQLNVVVQGGWSACSLALPPFAPSWESVEEIMRWQEAATSGQVKVTTGEVATTAPTAEPVLSAGVIPVAVAE